MSKDEFMYEHNLSSITDLLHRHMEFHGMIDETAKEKIEKTSNPREFFI